MPTYEYKCKGCGNTFEKFQSITDKPISHCERCEGRVYRLISKNVNFILKGSGFYSTDNRNNNRTTEKRKLPTSPKTEKNKKEISKETESKIKEKKSKEGSLK